MIQRLQSIFLFLSSASFFSHFGFSFAKTDAPGPNFFADQVYNIQDNIGLLIMAVLSGLLAFGIIFLFNNRKLQLKLSYIVIVLAILLPVLASLLFLNAGNSMENTQGIQDSIGLYMPIVSVILTWLAIRFINKDEKIVQSMDRLR